MYKFDCVCGEKLTVSAKTGRCPNCRRLFDLRWPNDAPPAAAELAKKQVASA